MAIGILIGTVIVLSLALSFIPNVRRQRIWRVRMVTFVCRRILVILNVTCAMSWSESKSRSRSRAILLIPNHVSYLDAVIIHSFFPSIFITSKEVSETRGLGFLAKICGCSFVERRCRLNVRKDIQDLSSILLQGINVTLFPEGTTTPGTHIQAFKSSLLQAALESQCLVRPACIRYENIDGEPVTDLNRDIVAWYGDMTFFDHFCNLLRTKRILVSVFVLPELRFRRQKSRKIMALQAWEAIQMALETQNL